MDILKDGYAGFGLNTGENSHASHSSKGFLLMASKAEIKNINVNKNLDVNMEKKSMIQLANYGRQSRLSCLFRLPTYHIL